MDFHRGLPDDLRSLNGFGPVPFVPYVDALDSRTMTTSHQRHGSSIAGDAQRQFVQEQEWPELLPSNMTLQHDTQANDENVSHLKSEIDFQDIDFMSIPVSSPYWSPNLSSSSPLIGPSYNSPINLARRSSPAEQHSLLSLQSQSLYHGSDGSSYGFVYAYPQDASSVLDKDSALPDFPLEMGASGEANDIQWTELTNDGYLALDSVSGAAPFAYAPSGMFETRAITASDIRLVESPASTCSSLYSSAPHTPLLLATTQAQAALPSSHLPPSPPGSLSSFYISSSSRSNTPDQAILKRSTPSSRSGATGAGKMCTHCKTISTPLWRRDPRTREPLCNACGLYLLQRRKQRPQALIDADAAFAAEEENSQALDAMGALDDGAPMCCHCRTRKTSVWRRRGRDGAQLCNACGVYLRLRGKDRPLTLRSRRIRPRTKHAPA